MSSDFCFTLVVGAVCSILIVLLMGDDEKRDNNE